jgi:hypothetical protein
LGNNIVSEALRPNFERTPEGAVTLNLGPTARDTFCLPKEVRPENVGIIKTLVVFAVQLSVHSTAVVIPAPDFQL